MQLFCLDNSYVSTGPWEDYGERCKQAMNDYARDLQNTGIYYDMYVKGEEEEAVIADLSCLLNGILGLNKTFHQIDTTHYNMAVFSLVFESLGGVILGVGLAMGAKGLCTSCSKPTAKYGSVQSDIIPSGSGGIEPVVEPITPSRPESFFVEDTPTPPPDTPTPSTKPKPATTCCVDGDFFRLNNCDDAQIKTFLDAAIKNGDLYKIRDCGGRYPGAIYEITVEYQFSWDTKPVFYSVYCERVQYCGAKCLRFQFIPEYGLSLDCCSAIIYYKIEGNSFTFRDYKGHFTISHKHTFKANHEPTFKANHDTLIKPKQSNEIDKPMKENDKNINNHTLKEVKDLIKDYKDNLIIKFCIPYDNNSYDLYMVTKECFMGNDYFKENNLTDNSTVIYMGGFNEYEPIYEQLQSRQIPAYAGYLAGFGGFFVGLGAIFGIVGCLPFGKQVLLAVGTLLTIIGGVMIGIGSAVGYCANELLSAMSNLATMYNCFVSVYNYIIY
ncbi:MAG: hypothetical protein LBR15_01060 [Methanobrevibacter sp.]|jgi:hypothetical protein|nr:hypothetical protein [Candidatus Methanovirga australis]